MTKDSNENVYCDVRVQIFRFLKKFLHEAIFLEFLKYVTVFNVIAQIFRN